MRGDDLYIGYIYTSDALLAETTTLRNYNFYLRRHDAAAATWNAPRNLSNFTLTTINVLEPRLVGTPGNGPGCPDPNNPATITDPRDCQNSDILIAAWGSETNVNQPSESPENLDIFITRSGDNGRTFERVVIVAGGAQAQGELQLRTTPDGSEVYGVWNETDANGASNTVFNFATVVTVTDPPVVATGGGSSGCALFPSAQRDPLLPVLLLVSAGYLLWSRARSSTQAGTGARHLFNARRHGRTRDAFPRR